MTTPTVASSAVSPAAERAISSAPDADPASAAAPATNAVRVAIAAQGAGARRPFLGRLLGHCPLRTSAQDAFAAAVRHVDLARRLTVLGETWTAFEAPSIPLGPIAADFVAVGPAGIIIIGSATAVAAPPSDAAAARATGFRTAISRALETDVPVLTFHVGRTAAPARADVTVVHARDLVDIIAELPEALAPAQVTALTRLVSETFDPAARTTPDERDAFLTLSADVAGAERTRGHWYTTLAVVAAIGLAAGISLLV